MVSNFKRKECHAAFCKAGLNAISKLKLSLGFFFPLVWAAAQPEPLSALTRFVNSKQEPSAERFPQNNKSH